MRLLGRASGVLVLVALLSLWQTLGWLGVLSGEAVPSPVEIVRAIVVESMGGDLLIEAITSARHLVVGFALAVAIAVPLGFALGRSRVLYLLLEPIIEFLRPLPVIAILPIAVLVLGLGDRMIYCVIALGCGWVVLLHAMDGARNVDPVLIDTGRTLQVSPLRRVFTILLPAAAPEVFTGLRVGISLAAIITIVVELVSGFSGGLGDYIGQLEGALRTPEAYGGLMVTTILGYALARGIEWLEHLLLPWHKGMVLL